MPCVILDAGTWGTALNIIWGPAGAGTIKPTSASLTARPPPPLPPPQIQGRSMASSSDVGITRDAHIPPWDVGMTAMPRASGTGLLGGVGAAGHGRHFTPKGQRKGHVAGKERPQLCAWG